MIGPSRLRHQSNGVQLGSAADASEAPHYAVVIARAPLAYTLGCIMVRRLTTTKWYSYLNWFSAKDEWSFELDGLEFRVINQWIGPTTLLQGDRVLAQDQAAFETSGNKPFLIAKVRTSESMEHSIAVYVKAILTVTIKIEVDGKEISNGFI